MSTPKGTPAFHEQEIRRIENVYEHRDIDSESRYSWLDFSNLYTVQERDRAVAGLWQKHGFMPSPGTRALDVGGGSGKGGRWLLELGVLAENIHINDLMPQRLKLASSTLPSAVKLHAGDATTLELKDHSFDIVMQSVVFSSILDQRVQAALASTMWRLLKPGGGILWYDFTIDNPSNKNVAGVGLEQVRRLFPDASVHSKKITLAPPISRAVCRIQPALYPVLNAVPWLRTHRLCWITH
ncbi:MAG: class I SAM-dependent methyltransferase [Granulosicoccus sp.]